VAQKMHIHSINNNSFEESQNIPNYLIIVIVYTGNVVNGTIGKQMVDTLVESASNVEVKFDLFEFVCIEVFKNLTDDINFAVREI
jgi:hypothetical protein